MAKDRRIDNLPLIMRDEIVFALESYIKKVSKGGNERHAQRYQVALEAFYEKRSHITHTMSESVYVAYEEKFGTTKAVRYVEFVADSEKLEILNQLGD